MKVNTKYRRYHYINKSSVKNVLFNCLGELEFSVISNEEGLVYRNSIQNLYGGSFFPPKERLVGEFLYHDDDDEFEEEEECM